MKIAVIGNCQGAIVAHAIETALDGQPDFAVRYIPSYEHATPEDHAFVQSAEKVLNQVTDRPPKNRLLEELQGSSRDLVHYPLLSCNFLYPFSIRPHPRSIGSRAPHIPAGFYQDQLSDNQLITLMEKSPDSAPEDIAEEYLALDYNDIIGLDELLARSRAKVERAGAISGLNLWPRIEGLFRYQPIFWTNLHPAEVLLRPLCKFALERLQLGLSGPEIDAATKNLERLGFAHMPIHPSIIRHFGIEWATPHYRYKGFHEGDFTAREYVCRYVRFDHDDALAKAIYELYHDGDLQLALSELRAAEERHPDGLEIPINLSVAYLRMGSFRDALESAVSALRRYPEQKEWASHVCNLARLTLDSIQTEAKTAPQVQTPVVGADANENRTTTGSLMETARPSGRGWRRLVPRHWRRFGRSDRRSEPSALSQAAE
jgi:hypothetical protein